MKVPLSRPYINQHDRDTVNDVLNSEYLALGPYLEKFENIMKKFTGSKYSVGVNSGTSALHLILKAMGFSEDYKLIVTPFTFIASSNVALYEKGKPVFIDIDPYNYNISADALKKYISSDNTEKTFFMGVDVFGQSPDWDEIIKILPDNVKIVEDSCEALGSEYKNKKLSLFGEAGTFAFYPNKQITTGEGGLILTDNEDIYVKTKSMANQGRGTSMEWLDHVRIGYNFRLDEMSAALGYSQMLRIDEITQKRQKVAENYYKLFEDENRIVLPKIEKFMTKMSWFVYVIRFNTQWINKIIKLPDYIKNIELPEKIKTDEWKTTIFKIKNIQKIFIEKLSKLGIQSKNYFSPIHVQDFYKKSFGYDYGDYPVTELISSMTAAIPFYTEMDTESQIYVAECVKRVLKEIENEVHF
ncbi:MAG TPA: DegT/DnrJ/EryC1/StrS aminotransferase family protein [Tepiditoga sp.]|nr:DegT/DnrJ/EryC1/StrS aminotransferase family protein [Thermotogota bacterium]HOO73996.1 DegT/DnrJ/EryC1/StrS aminotransferase family protein [Tepiditoga sp.]